MITEPYIVISIGYNPWKLLRWSNKLNLYLTIQRHTDKGWIPFSETDNTPGYHKNTLELWEKADDVPNIEQYATLDEFIEKYFESLL